MTDRKRAAFYGNTESESVPGERGDGWSRHRRLLLHSPPLFPSIRSNVGAPHFLFTLFTPLLKNQLVSFQPLRFSSI